MNTENIDKYIATYREIQVKVNEQAVAIAVLKELGKDARMERLPVSRGRGDNEATEKQLALLRRLGVAIPEGLTKRDASGLIDTHKP